MIRCIAIDLDDTLLQSDLTISDSNRDAIQKATQAGIKVLLASGRMVQSMKPYADELKLNVPLIAYNGAIIQEAVSGQILYHRPVPVDLSKEILDICRTENVHLNVYLNDQLYMDNLTEWGKIYAKNAGVTPYPVEDLNLILNQPPHKLLGVGEVEKIDSLKEILHLRIGDRLDFVKSKPTYLEILAPGVSKGAALEELAGTWGIDRSQVMAIGDAPNDISMIRWAGVGVAIGNANPKVKEIADFIVADHNLSGVAEAIQKVVFNY